MTDPARRALLAAIAALPACAASGPAGMPSGPLPAPTVRIGDRWRYQVIERPRDRWIDEPTYEVVEAGPEIRLKVTGRRGGPPQEERFAGPWAALVETMYGLPYVFNAPVPLVPQPLQAGSVHATTTSYTDLEGGRPRRWSQQLAVRGWESVTVPAGRFDCLRMSRVIAFEHPDRFRQAATRTDTLWYSPQVNRWVQRELRGEFTSAGVSAENPGEGLRGVEEWLLMQLTAWVPSPVSR